MFIAILTMAIGLILVSLIWLLKSSGLFKPILINITQPPFEQLTIAYKFQCGDYSKSGDLLKAICNYSPLHFKLGIYYDNPEVVSVENRRFAVGMIVDEIKDRELIERMEKDNYQIFKLPKPNRSIYTTFQFTNNLSVFIAILRVPYRLADYIRANKLEAHPFIEIYCRPLIHYFLPLDNFEAYNVPEINNELSFEKNINPK